MNKRIIHRKQLDKLTKAEFSYKDVTIYQDGDLVVIDKDQILELAQLIQNERNDQEFYENLKTKRRMTDEI
jgi:hypothetical protein